jgi:hypothetical protein
MFVQFFEVDGRDGNATVLMAPAVHGPMKSDVTIDNANQ